MNRKIYVQYGCGISAPEGWLNFDASPRLRLERIPGLRQVLQSTVGLLFPSNVKFGNIVRGLPVPNNVASAVYCSHVLEHLARDELKTALRNTFKILIPGGEFRLVVPDLHWRVAQYLTAAERGDPLAADQFITVCHLGGKVKPKSIMDLIKSHYGNSMHLWMYDFAALNKALMEAGFISIRRCKFGDSTNRIFDLVEDKGRFFDSGESELAIETLKPPSIQVTN